MDAKLITEYVDEFQELTELQNKATLELNAALACLIEKYKLMIDKWQDKAFETPIYTNSILTIVSSLQAHVANLESEMLFQNQGIDKRNNVIKLERKALVKFTSAAASSSVLENLSGFFDLSAQNPKTPKDN